MAEAKKINVTVVLIDLRCGITEEDAKNGKFVERGMFFHKTY